MTVIRMLCTSRFGRPKDVAAAVALLRSRAVSGSTGRCFPVNGGTGLGRPLGGGAARRWLGSGLWRPVDGYGIPG
ncbi:hypothetical protein GCM10023175_04230 [Pseudonocardia xishanensis]|uniref:Uncharacterized protein n=1 Tax=Pseudonocardia xishanensis TaxID=630995 RepID=A0ABP8RFK0_9PSEU